jgi:transcriptional regulator with XRE-family HTH domain
MPFKPPEPIPEEPEWTGDRQMPGRVSSWKSMDLHAQLAARIGTRTKMLRRKNHLTQTALGSLIGVSRTWISKIESGRVEPFLASIHRLSSALKVEPKILLLSDRELLVEQFFSHPFLRNFVGLAAGQREQILEEAARLSGTAGALRKAVAEW